MPTRPTGYSYVREAQRQQQRQRQERQEFRALNDPDPLRRQNAAGMLGVELPEQKMVREAVKVIERDTKAQAAAQAKASAAAERANLAAVKEQQKEAARQQKEQFNAEKNRREAQFIADKRPTYTDANGMIQPKDSDADWERKKQGEQAAVKATADLEVQKRGVDATEKAIRDVDAQFSIRGKELRAAALAARKRAAEAKKSLAPDAAELAEQAKSAETAAEQAGGDELAWERNKLGNRSIVDSANTQIDAAKERAKQVKEGKLAPETNLSAPFVPAPPTPDIPGEPGTENERMVGPDGSPVGAPRTMAEMRVQEGSRRPLDPLNYERRAPFPGEDAYFKANPHVAGMAGEDGKIVLNPHSKLSKTEMEAVAANEGMRLWMRENNYAPSFNLSNEQRQQFKGTAYEKNEDALKQSIVARILSGDPSAKATQEQLSEARQLGARLGLSGSPVAPSNPGMGDLRTAEAAEAGPRTPTLDEQIQSHRAEVEQFNAAHEAANKPLNDVIEKVRVRGIDPLVTQPDGSLGFAPGVTDEEKQMLRMAHEAVQKQRPKLESQAQEIDARGTALQAQHQEAVQKQKAERDAQLQQMRSQPGLAETADKLSKLDSEFEAVTQKLDPQNSEEDRVALQAIQDQYAQDRDAAMGLGEERQKAAWDDAAKYKADQRSATAMSFSEDGVMTPTDYKDVYLPKFASEHGMTVEQAGNFIDDHTKAVDNWDGGDKVRALSTGKLAVNPALYVEPAEYRKAVEASGASAEAKAEALEKLPALEEASLTAMLPHIAGAPGFHEFALKNGAEFFDPNTYDLSKWTPAEIEERKAKSKFKTPAELVRAYRDGPGKDWWRNQLHQAILGAASGTAAMGQQATGLYGAITGNEGAIKTSLDLSSVMRDMAMQSSVMQSGQWTKKLTEGGVSILPAALGGAVLPRAAAMYGSAIAAGGQSAGGTFTDAVQANMDRGMDMQSARKAALAPAIASGLTTAALTFGFGPTGVESMFAQNEFKQSGVQFLKSIAKESGLEFTEEAADQFMSGVIESLSYNPDKTFQQIVMEALEAGALGAVLGVGMSAVSNADRPVQPDEFAVENGHPQPAPVSPSEPVTPTPSLQNVADSALSDAELSAFDAGDPQVTAATVLQTRTLRDIAKGEPLSGMTDAQLSTVGIQRDETGALKNIKTKDAIPLVKIENGAAIITQGAINMLEQKFPRTRALIGMSETEARQRISQQQTESPAPTDATTSGAEATGEPRGSSPQAGAVPADSGAGLVAEGAAETSLVDAAPATPDQPPGERSTAPRVAPDQAQPGEVLSEPQEPGAVSKSWTVGKTATGGVVFKPDEPATESQPTPPPDRAILDIARPMVQAANASGNTKVAGTIAGRAKLLSSVISTTAKDFSAVRFMTSPEGSGPARLAFDGALEIDVEGILRTMGVKSIKDSRAWIESMIDEEFKHRVALDLHQNSPEFAQGLEDLYNSLPTSVKELSRAAYFAQVDKAGQKNEFDSDALAAHEFFRQYWQSAKLQKATESALTQKGILEKLRGLIAKFLKELRRIQKGAKHPSVKAAADRLIAQAEAKAKELRGVNDDVVQVEKVAPSGQGEKIPPKPNDTSSPPQTGPASKQSKVSPTPQPDETVGEVQPAIRAESGPSEERTAADRGEQLNAPPTGASSDPVTNALAELAKHDEFFRYKTSRSANLPTVMAEVFPDATFEGDGSRIDERAESDADRRYVFKMKESGNRFYIYERGRRGRDGEIWSNLGGLKPGEGGAGVAAAVANYAKNSRQTWIGDPMGMTEDALHRRPHAMLSAALRFGTTSFMEPGNEQLAGDPSNGITPLKWGGNDVDNVRALIDLVTSNLRASIPNFDGYKFDFQSGQFLDPAGRPVDAKRLSDAGRLPVARAARAGSATLRRGIFLQSLVSSGSGEGSQVLGQLIDGNNQVTENLRGIFTSSPSEQYTGPYADIINALSAHLVNTEPTPEELAALEEFMAMDGPATEPSKTEEKPQTSLKKRVVDEERAARGEPPIVRPIVESWGEAGERAEQMLAESPNAGFFLVNELKKQPRALKAHENALLLLHKVNVRHDLRKASREVNTTADGSEENKQAKALYDELLNHQNDIDVFSRQAGTESGRSLAARKMMRDEDTSEESLMQRYRTEVNLGRPLTEPQKAKVRKHAARIRRAQKDIDALDDETQAKLAERALQRLAADLGKSNPKREGVKSLVRSRAKDARERLKLAMAAQPPLSSPPATLSAPPTSAVSDADLAAVGADMIADGMTSASAFAEAIEKEFGITLAKDASRLFSMAARVYQASVAEFERANQPTALIEAVKGGEVNLALLTNLAKAHIRAGVTSAEEMVEKMTKELQELQPGITASEVQRILSGYGKTSQPTKDEVKRKLTEFNSQLRILSGIEDVSAGKPPLKSGFQRGKPSARVRELATKLRDDMRAAGIETTAEEQLASAKKAVTNRLNNQIADLTRIIEGRGSKRPEQNAIQYDDETNALLKERNELKAYVDDLLGPNAELKWNRKAQKAAKASEEYYKRRIATADFESRKLPGQTENADTRKAREDAKKAKEEFGLLRDATGIPQAEQLASIKTQLEKEIEKVRQRLITGQNPETPAKDKPSDAEVATLKETLARLRESVKLVEGSGMTEEQRAAAAAKAVQKSINRLEERIAKKDTTPTPKRTPADSEELRALRERRDFLSEIYDGLKEAQNPRRLPEEIALSNFRRNIERHRQELQNDLKAEKYLELPAPDPLFQSRRDRARFELRKAREEWNTELFNDKLARRTAVEKVLGYAGEALNLSRSILTSLDLSAVIRQGGFIGFGHPVLVAKSLGPMFKAFYSEENQFKAMEEIKARKNYPLYEQAKLYMTDMDELDLSKMEENYMSRFANKIPFVAGSQRAYVTFLNKLRADTFDLLAETLGRDGRVTEAEGKAVASFINVATGRGIIGSAQKAQGTPILSTIFFSPRLMASRFNLLMGQPIYGGSPRTRMLVAQQYGRFMAGIGTALALLSLFKDPDDDEPMLELDPRSADFLKAKFGNTRLDLFGGLLQATVLLSRLVSGQTKKRGKIVDIRGPEKPYSGDSTMDVLAKFIRSKLSPALGTAVNLAQGQDFAGEPVTIPGEALKMLVPMSLTNIKDVMEDQGVPRGVAITLLSLFGAGLQTYDGGSTIIIDPAALDELVKNWNRANPDDTWKPGDLQSDDFVIKKQDPVTKKKIETPMDDLQKKAFEATLKTIREQQFKAQIPESQVKKPTADALKTVQALRKDTKAEAYDIMRSPDWKERVVKTVGASDPQAAEKWKRRLENATPMERVRDAQMVNAQR